MSKVILEINCLPTECHQCENKQFIDGDWRAEYYCTAFDTVIDSNKYEFKLVDKRLPECIEAELEYNKLVDKAWMYDDLCK